MPKYQSLTPEHVKENPNGAVAQITSTLALPGSADDGMVDGSCCRSVSSVLALVGLPGSAAAQVAGIVAPIVIALVYVFSRARTKGALADALKTISSQCAYAAG